MDLNQQARKQDKEVKMLQATQQGDPQSQSQETQKSDAQPTPQQKQEHMQAQEVAMLKKLKTP